MDERKRELMLKYCIGDRVGIDGCIGFITGISIKGNWHVLYEITWMHNGDQKQKWFDEFLFVPEKKVKKFTIGFDGY